jgi:hypothetical protein
MARHQTFLVLGTVLIVAASIYVLTGRCFAPHQGIISRAEDPKTFWQTVAVCYVLGLLCLGLYLYTAN